MQSPRLLTTVRGLTIFVVIVALILGAAQFRQRRAFCLERATYHRFHTMFWNGRHLSDPIDDYPRLRMTRGRQARTSSSPPDEEKIRAYRERVQAYRRRDSHVDWHLRLAEKFEHAANRPWAVLPAEQECPGFDYFYQINVRRGLIANP
jgi:hypothetical protein